MGSRPPVNPIIGKTRADKWDRQLDDVIADIQDIKYALTPSSEVVVGELVNSKPSMSSMLTIGLLTVIVVKLFFFN